MRGTSALSAKQVRAIAALMTCRTLDAAAKAAQCDPSTLSRWLAKDALFQQAWQAARKQLLDQAVAQALRSAEEAALQLHRLMMDSLSDSVRVVAARALLDISMRTIERDEIEGKMQQLSEQMEALRHEHPLPT